VSISLSPLCLLEGRFKGYTLQADHHVRKEYKNPIALVTRWARLAAYKLKKDMEEAKWCLQEQQQQMQTGWSSSGPLVQALPGVLAGQEGAQLAQGELPRYFNSLENQLPGYTTATTDAANQGLGSTTAAGANLFSQYGPLLNDIQQYLGGQNLQSNANNIGSTLNSQGAQNTIGGFNSLQNQLNPSYASTMNNLSSLMQNQNPNALSGSEQAQIERGLNQTNYQGGNYGVGNPLTEINNATTFGTGLQQKQANFANLASSTANTANSLTGGNNAFGLTTNQPSGTSSANTSTNANSFLQSPSNLLSTATGGSALGAGLAGLTTSGFNAGNTAAAGQNTSSAFNTGVSCCFVAILGSQYMPWYIRSLRDLMYADDPLTYNGYSTMANVLVPLFYIPCIYWLTKRYMIQPLVEHGGYIMSEKGCRSRSGYYKFWKSVWHFVGKLKSK